VSGGREVLARAGGDQWADDAAAYAVGALDADERGAFEAHLAGCAECASEVRAHREVATLLARGLGGAAAAPSPALRARIVTEAVAQGASGRARPLDARQQPLRARTATASMQAVAPARRATPWTPWLAAAAALVLAAGLGAGWAREREVRVAERQQAIATLRRVAQADARHAAADADARRVEAQADTLIGALTAPDVKVARLAVAGEPAAMRLLWSPGRGIVVLTAAAMPRPRQGRTYQLWGIPRGGTPQSLGVFVPGADGRVRAVLRVPPEAEMQVAAVTEEPEGGSVRPTSAPLMVGGIGAS